MFVYIFFNLFIGINVFLYMVFDIDNLMLVEDGIKFLCNGIYNSYWYFDLGYGYKNSRVIFFK